MTPEQVLGWAPDTLASAADDLASDRRKLMDLQDEVDGARPPSDWSGADADAARDSHRRMYDQLADLVAPLSRVVEALETAAREIKNAQRELGDTQQAVSGRGWSWEYAGGSFTVTPADDAGEGATGEAERLAGQMADAFTRAVRADETLAGVLQSAARGQYDTDADTLAEAALPERWQDLTDRELAQVVAQNPNLANDPVLMSAIEQRIANYVPATASADAADLAEGDLDAAGKVALVTAYGEYAQQQGEPMPRAAAEYLRGVVSSSFPDDGNSDTADISGAVDAQQALDEASQGNWTNGLLADSLLLASDGGLNPQGQDILGADAVPAEATQALHDVPQSMTEAKLDSASIGGGGYHALAGLLAKSDSGIEAGQAFSRDMTTTTADLITNMNTWEQQSHDSGRGSILGNPDFNQSLSGYTPAMQQMLDVATRNEEANAAFLHDASAGENGAQQQLASLYTHDWEDNGAAVAGYTDWISETLNPETRTPDMPSPELAEQATVDLVSTVTDTSTEDGSPNMFRELMGGGDPHGPPFGAANPQLAHSLGDVTGQNLDAVSAPLMSRGTQIGPEGAVEIGGEDRGRLFTLVNTDPGAATDLNTQVGVYQAEQLREAVASGEDSALQNAGATNSMLDGYMNAGRVNATMISDRLGYEVDMADYQESQRAAGLAKTTAMTALSAHPYGALTAPAADAGGDMLIDTLITPPENPTAHDVGDASDPGVLQNRAAYDVIQTREEITGDTGIPPGSEALTEQGELKPWDQIQTDGVRDLHDSPMVEEYIDHSRFRPAETFDETVIDSKGRNTEEAVRGYLNGTTG